MKTRVVGKSEGRGIPAGILAVGCQVLLVLVLLGLAVELSPMLAGLGRMVKISVNIAARSGAPSYFAGGLWRADVRTLGATVRYLLEREPSTPAEHLALAANPDKIPLQVRAETRWNDAPFAPPKRLFESATNGPART